MDKKKIIQIVIIIAAFGGSGIVLYNGFFKSSSAPPPINITAGVPGGASGAAVPASNSAILPDGSSMNFDVLDSHNQTYGAVNYPVLNTSTDVGIYDPATQSYIQPLLK